MPTVRTHTRIQGLMSIVHVSTFPVLVLVRTPGLLRCRSSISNLDSCGLWQTGGDGAMAVEHANVFRTPAAHDPALAEAVRRLVEAYQPESVYLFGSVARGDA